MEVKVQRAKNESNGNCQYVFVVGVVCLLIREEKKSRK